ncbi:unnamed protein product, partial [Symbiodinium sp. KB8]
ANGIEEQLNNATRKYLERQRDVTDVTNRLSSLRSSMAALQRTKDLRRRLDASAAVRAEAEAAGREYVEEDEEIQGLDGASLPTAEKLERQLEDSRASIAEAERAKERLTKKVKELAERQTALQQRAKERREEADRLRGMSSEAVEALLQAEAEAGPDA